MHSVLVLLTSYYTYIAGHPQVEHPSTTCHPPVQHEPSDQSVSASGEMIHIETTSRDHSGQKVYVEQQSIKRM